MSMLYRYIDSPIGRLLLAGGLETKLFLLQPEGASLHQTVQNSLF